jgi:predicted DNA-binding WGR domain protein
MRQLSFAFLQAELHHVSSSPFAPVSLGSVAMRRIDPTKNMARFYSLEVERDLFGKAVLVRRWGRIGTAGRTRLDEHAGEGEAMTALMKMEKAKQRRGYQPAQKP